VNNAAEVELVSVVVWSVSTWDLYFVVSLLKPYFVAICHYKTKENYHLPVSVGDAIHIIEEEPGEWGICYTS